MYHVEWSLDFSTAAFHSLKCVISCQGFLKKNDSKNLFLSIIRPKLNGWEILLKSVERRNTTHQFLSTAKRFVFSLFCGILAQLSTQANTFFWPMAGTSGRFCEGTPWGSSHATFYFLCVLHVGGDKWWQDVSLQMVQVQTKCSVPIAMLQHYMFLSINWL